MSKQKKDLSKTYFSTTSYYSDLYDAQTLRAVLIRSPISSGTIRSISLSDIPEGYSLFTADDIPNTNEIKIFNTTFSIFAKDKISYKGEPIGILIGPNRSKLYDLLDEVQILFTEGFTQKKPKNNDTQPQNIVASRKVSYGATKTIKEKVKHIIETNHSLKLDIDETTETNGALCYAGKTLNVYTPTLWASSLRSNLERVTGYNKSSIIIHKTKQPITEKNAPWKNTTLAVQCAIASILTKKSVLLCLSHDEQNLYDNFSCEINTQHTSHISKHGKIISSDVKIFLDIGAYNPFASIIVDRLAIAAMGSYAPAKLNIEVIAHESENPPTTSDIRWLDYHCFYAIESHLKQIALKTSIDPAEIRMTNLITQGKKHPFQFDTTTYKDLLAVALKKSDFYRKYEAYRQNPYTKKSKKEYFPVRGIGLATAYEANGFLGAMIDTSAQSLELTIDKNGKVILRVLNASATVAMIWKEIASSILSVNIEDITIDSMYGQYEEAAVPETMLSNMYITAQLLKKACIALQKLRFHQPLPITVKRTFNLANKKTWNSVSFTGKPFYVTSWIAIIAEIELKIPIYSFEIRSIWVCVDAGNVMNKKKARYAIHSCIKKILSQAMKNQTYTQPDISVTFLESTDEPKQIRELVYNALPAALSNALSQTVDQLVSTYPIEQESIFKMFQDVQYQSEKKMTEEDIVANKPSNK